MAGKELLVKGWFEANAWTTKQADWVIRRSVDDFYFMFEAFFNEFSSYSRKFKERDSLVGFFGVVLRRNHSLLHPLLRWRLNFRYRGWYWGCLFLVPHFGVGETLSSECRFQVPHPLFFRSMA